MIIVAMAIAATALFSPNFSTIVSAIFSADPVLIRAPARIPLVRILRTEDIMEPAPLTIVLTVFESPPPPIRPPISAPRIRLYAGCTFLMIMIIAIIRPTIAPKVVNCASIPFPSFQVKLGCENIVYPGGAQPPACINLCSVACQDQRACSFMPA